MNNLLLFPEPPRRPQPPDAEVRAESLDVRRSFIVQAPAGSGKTTLLVQRLLKLLADESVTAPEQVLAITFTKAATAELRDRVLRVLAKAAAAQRDSAEQGVVESLAASGSADALEDRAEFDELTLELARDVAARDAELGWGLLAHPRRLNIRTIDSVCAEIARSLPVLSGSGGALTPSEDATALHREAARRTLLKLGGGDPEFDAALRILLRHRDGNLANCEDLITEMLALRDQWGELVPLNQRELDDVWLDRNLLPRLEHALDSAICATLARLQSLFPADLLHDLASLAGHLGYLPGANGDPSPIACCAGVHDPPEAIASELARWRALIHLLVTAAREWRRRVTGYDLKFELAKNHPHRGELQNILAKLQGRDELLAVIAEVNELPDPRYPANQWAVAKALFRILSRALVELQLVFAERGACDFTEVGLLARAALDSGNGQNDLADALGARLQHLLVDEMQDTSTGQYHLLELLTASWDGHSQTVFLVGDPYQSVYLFRQARMERFVQALETRRLGELPLTSLALTANFRSQRTLVDQFNEDFSLIFPAPIGDGSHYRPALQLIRAQATQPASATEGRVWHAHPQPGRAAPVASAPPRLDHTQAHRDAERVAATAREWLARPLPSARDRPWSVAVLVRSRNHLAEIIPALRRAAIPFRAVDIETLRDRQEVLDLTALTRALLHPGDRVAALAVLRAPWCGLPLADLHTLTGADDSSFRERPLVHLIEARGHLLPADSQRRLARVAAVLGAAMQANSRLTTAQLVERAWRSLGGDAPLAAAELTNARRFFELLDALEISAGRVDPAQLQDRLARLFAEPDPLPAHGGFVELLTIHKAKGLEWDLVFVPALERRPASSPMRLLTWSVLDDVEPRDSGAAHIMLAPIAARGEDVDPLTRWLKRRHREREYAENKRLFYVACTRARHELHLFAAPTVSSHGISPGSSDSLLRAAWPAAEPHCVARQAASQTRGVARGAVAFVDERMETTIELAASSGDGTNEPEITRDDSPELQAGYQAVDANLIAPVYPLIERLPLSFDPASRFSEAAADRLPNGEPTAVFERSQFARPEGSFAARSFGNVVHSCVELFAARIAAGSSPATLLLELPSWQPRVTALLRADGLPGTTVARLARETRNALETLLRDPDGQWLLAAHPGAASEFSLTAVDAGGSGRAGSVRVDRIFYAGPEPRIAGTDHLWIVDYKTASHSAANVDEFFAAQRAAYSQQLEAYGRVLAPARSVAPENVRLALYFPAISGTPRMLWWPMGARVEEQTADLATSN